MTVDEAVPSVTTAKQRARESATLSVGIAVAGAVIALVGVIAGVWVALATIEANKANEIRATRTEAYADYVASLAVFNEFVWGNVHWAGTDPDKQPAPEDLSADFWEPARALQAEIESTYWVASAVAGNEKVRDALGTLRSAQGDMLLKFKCMGGLQTLRCELHGAQIPMASQAEITRELESWGSSTDEARATLWAEAQTQLLN